MRIKPVSGTQRLATLALLLAVPWVVAGCGDEDDAQTSAGSAGERAFLTAMVPHHQSAVEMARTARSRAKHIEIRELAQAIISTQQLEIRRMKEIHRRVFGEPLVADDGAHMKLGLSAADAGMDHGGMAGLESARPFDRAFIDAMIPHHAGAIRMAHAVMADAPDDEIVDLADGIIQAQSKEIRQLNEWRVRWYGERSPAGGVPQPAEREAGGAAHEGH